MSLADKIMAQRAQASGVGNASAIAAAAQKAKEEKDDKKNMSGNLKNDLPPLPAVDIIARFLEKLFLPAYQPTNYEGLEAFEQIKSE